MKAVSQILRKPDEYPLYDCSAEEQILHLLVKHQVSLNKLIDYAARQAHCAKSNRTSQNTLDLPEFHEPHAIDTNVKLSNIVNGTKHNASNCAHHSNKHFSTCEFSDQYRQVKKRKFDDNVFCIHDSLTSESLSDCLNYYKNSQLQQSADWKSYNSSSPMLDRLNDSSNISFNVMNDTCMNRINVNQATRKAVNNLSSQADLMDSQSANHVAQPMMYDWRLELLKDEVISEKVKSLFEKTNKLNLPQYNDIDTQSSETSPFVELKGRDTVTNYSVSAANQVTVNSNSSTVTATVDELQLHTTKDDVNTSNYYNKQPEPKKDIDQMLNKAYNFFTQTKYININGLLTKNYIFSYVEKNKQLCRDVIAQITQAEVEDLKKNVYPYVVAPFEISKTFDLESRDSEQQRSRQANAKLDSYIKKNNSYSAKRSTVRSEKRQQSRQAKADQTSYNNNAKNTYTNGINVMTEQAQRTKQPDSVNNGLSYNSSFNNDNDVTESSLCSSAMNMSNDSYSMLKNLDNKSSQNTATFSYKPHHVNTDLNNEQTDKKRTAKRKTYPYNEEPSRTRKRQSCRRSPKFENINNCPECGKRGQSIFDPKLERKDGQVYEYFYCRNSQCKKGSSTCRYIGWRVRKAN